MYMFRNYEREMQIELVPQPSQVETFLGQNLLVCFYLYDTLFVRLFRCVIVVLLNVDDRTPKWCSYPYLYMF